jgi:hypothetical protein
MTGLDIDFAKDYHDIVTSFYTAMQKAYPYKFMGYDDLIYQDARVVVYRNQWKRYRLYVPVIIKKRFLFWTWTKRILQCYVLINEDQKISYNENYITPEDAVELLEHIMYALPVHIIQRVIPMVTDTRQGLTDYRDILRELAR